MLKLNRNSIIYVLCPSMRKTGGTELSHQLVYQINKFGGNAIIAYYDVNNKDLEINEAFKKYVSSFISLKNIDDSANNVIVSPENRPWLLNNFSKIQKCIWWMSVDNFICHKNVLYCFKRFGVISTIKGLLKRRLSFGMPKFNCEITHFYQSEYALNFLKKIGIEKSYHLSDYLNEEYFNLNINTSRKNIVLYNPAKGLAFTQKLMKIAPGIQWVALQNMTTEQVKETLLHSKVYIDFGNHPGKDRFPREAAMCGCCVITGKRGSAKFFEDVPIANEFKFDESRKTIPQIISKIQECLNNYEVESPKFNGYREFIKSEYQTFQDDVKSIFSIGKKI